jgi:hypothetical protein
MSLDQCLLLPEGYVGGAASPLLTGLFAYYTLDEASGTATDSLGSRNLTAFNSPVSTTGKIGNARNFVSASSQRLSSSATDFAISGDFSIAFWWTTTTIGDGSPIVSIGDDYNQCDIGHASSGLVAAFLGGLSNAAFSATTLTEGVARHLAVVRSGTSLRLYVNGTGGTAATNSTAPTSGKLHLGYGSYQYGDCWIDELGFWSRALTGAEITQLYNSGSGLTYPFA